MKLQREQSVKKNHQSWKFPIKLVISQSYFLKMADLDDFFAKKDKKKKTKGAKGFSIANTKVLAKNLEENERKEQQAEEKANDASRGPRIVENPSGLNNEV